MNLQTGEVVSITFADNSVAKVRLVEIEHSRSGMFPDDYWFEYVEGETNKQVVHPDFKKSPLIKSEILLPEGLVDLVITRANNLQDIQISEYDSKLKKYLEKNMRKEDHAEGISLFNRLKNLMSEEEIIKKYFDKE